MADENAPKIKYLKDYKKPDYKIESVNLDFDLGEETTRVLSKMKVKSDYDASTGEVRPLRLDGDELTLTELALNGRPLKPEELEKFVSASAMFVQNFLKR